MAGEKGFAARDKAGTTVSILVGGVFGIGLIGFCLALATLVFSGPLSQYLAFGTGVFLLSTALFNVLGALRSPFPFGTASVQDVSIAVLAPAVTMAAVGAQGAPEAPFATAMAVMGGPNVVVDVPSVILKWPSETIDRLEREDVELAILLHRLIAKNLAIAAHKNNRLIEEYF